MTTHVPAAILSYDPARTRPLQAWALIVFSTLAGGISVAVGFWGPMLGVYALADSVSLLQVLLMTILCTATALVLLLAVHLLLASLLPRTERSVTALGATSLLAIWFSGPACMLVAASLSTGSLSLSSLVMMTLAAPVSTPLLATYNGTLLALILVSCSLLAHTAVCAIVQRALQPEDR